MLTKETKPDKNKIKIKIFTWILYLYNQINRNPKRKKTDPSSNEWVRSTSKWEQEKKQI